MSSIFSIRKNYTVKRDHPKIATKGTFPQLLTALNDNKGYHQLLFHDINYNLFLILTTCPKTEKNQYFIF
jgi:ABC-type long-subunit fatty acid transport system fused permease/ATPase subunit